MHSMIHMSIIWTLWRRMVFYPWPPILLGFVLGILHHYQSKVIIIRRCHTTVSKVWHGTMRTLEGKRWSVVFPLYSNRSFVLLRNWVYGRDFSRSSFERTLVERKTKQFTQLGYFPINYRRFPLIWAESSLYRTGSPHGTPLKRWSTVFLGYNEYDISYNQLMINEI